MPRDERIGTDGRGVEMHEIHRDQPRVRLLHRKQEAVQNVGRLRHVLPQLRVAPARAHARRSTTGVNGVEGKHNMVEPAGFEPATYWLQTSRSTN